MSRANPWPRPMPDTIPGVVECNGGWFAITNPEDTLGSGPWNSKEAAQAIIDGDIEKAHDLHRSARRR